MKEKSDMEAEKSANEVMQAEKEKKKEPKKAIKKAASASSAQDNALGRSVDLLVSVADLENEITQRLMQFSSTVKMPGFRPGKVPLKMVKQQYGAQARHEALNHMIEHAFQKVVIEQKLQVAGQPKVEPKPEDEQGNKEYIAFSAKFEVYPEITLKELNGVVIERPKLEIGDAEIEKTIEILRKQRVNYQLVERPAKKEDRVIVDFVGKKSGEPFEGGSGADYPFVLGEKTMLPEFEQAAEGMSAGEQKNFELTFPEEYFSKDLSGQKVQFELSVKQVLGPHLPQIDADFVRQLGVQDGDVEKMRTEVSENLQREAKRRVESRVKEQIMDVLLESNPIEVPQSLMQIEINRMAQQAAQDMKDRGLQTNDLQMKPEWFAEKAKRRVSLGLIVSELTQAHDLKATAEQIKALIEENAASFENPKEVVNWHYSDPERMAQVEAIALESNVVDWVISQAKVVDKAISFDELMGQ